MRSPIRWYGGKGQMLTKLLPLLPPHQTYVEPFAGGAAVFFAKAPAPVEVLNDLDSGLVNFYRVLRDPALFAAFARLCELTPYSREEWQTCRRLWAQEPDSVTRAWRWFVWVRQQFGGGGQTHGGWSLVVSESTSGRAESVSNWLRGIDGLIDVHTRLQAAQIEHQDWRTIFAQYDTPDTLFYCDPPYITDTRGQHRYEHEMIDADHKDLVAMILRLQGKVVLSGYDHPIYAPLVVAGWQQTEWTLVANVAQRRTIRIEKIWRSPSCVRDLGPLFTGVTT